MRILFLALLSAFCFVPAAHAQAPMTNDRIPEILQPEVDDITGQTGMWEVSHRDRMLLIITDEKANRMRIITPIVPESMLDEGDMKRMLEANFDSALDAKYSLYEGFVISVFTHPLRELSDGQLLDAIDQVVNLADTYGTTYSSTDLLFGGKKEESEQESPPVNQSPKKRKRS